MKYFFSMSLFVSFVLALYFALRFFWSREKKMMEDWLVAVCCLASAIWSFGFGMLILQTDTDKAYFCRTVGMVGVFLYLITAQMLVCHISGMKKSLRYLFDGISLTGIIVYFLVIQKSEVVYWLDEMGMTYSFRPGFCNNVYMLYSVVMAINILYGIIYMMRCTKVKRLHAFARKFLLVEVLIFFGMTLDTVFPLIGEPAIPGSSLTQFWGLVTLHYAVRVNNRSRINITNMSDFIYYSLTMPVLVYDADRRLQIINDAASSFLEINAEKETGKIGLGQYFDVVESEAFTFEEKRKDIDAVCRKNQLYCSLAVSKISDAYGDIIGYIILVTDLSERMKNVQKLEEAIREAEAANRAKSTFLANMSHEIRTPMNAIIGFSELLLKMELQPQAKEYIEDIKTSSGNLLAIINDILDISKIESGKMELVCADYYTVGLFNDVFLIINAQAKKKGLDFHMSVDPNVPNKLFGDKIRIRSVLINLLNNAVKYTNKGEVSLAVTVRNKKDGIVTLEFKVSDTGIGIRPEEQEKLFESFSQVDCQSHYGVEGTGLGLAIVKGYAALMGGSVTVESVYGKGSVFTAAIEQKIVDDSPLDRAYAKEDEIIEDFSIGTMKIEGVRVLVVDDNQINLKVAGSSLSYYGLIVDTAASGAEAIRLCRQNRYKLVFMDQMMPQMDGIEAMRRIRELDAYYDFGGISRIIVLTANAISGVRDELLQQGFDEYLGKPMNFKQLERLFLKFLPKENIKLEQTAGGLTDTAGLGTAAGLADTAGLAHADGSVNEADAQSETAALQKMLPQVEIVQGIANCGGHLEDYLSILQVVYEEGEEQIRELRSLQQQENYADYTVMAHALKGAALNIGAGNMADMAKQQELAGKRGENTFIDDHMEEFLQEYGLLLEKIRTVLEKYRMLENAQEGAVKEEDVTGILREIKKSIEEYDFAEASELIRETGKKQLPEPYPQIFEQLEQFMKEVELDKLGDLLDRFVM